MGLKISTGIDLYDHINAQTWNSFYGVNSIGGQVRAGMPFTDALSGNVFLGYEQDTYSTSFNYYDNDSNSATPQVPGTPESQLVSDGTIRNKPFAGYNLNYVTLDDQKHPTTGIYAVLSQQYWGGDSNVLSTTVKARGFLPVGDTGMVASLRGEAGILNSLSGGTVNTLDAYHVGSDLIRGFEYNGLGPRLQAPGCEPVGATCSGAGRNGTNFSSWGGEALGETGYAGLAAELDFPLPLLPPSYGLSGAVWADTAYINGTPAFPANANPKAGAGAVDPNSVIDNFKATVGASVIWDGPFGPLRADFGYVLKDAPTDRPQVFQITMQSLL
jgi:outer membrane protein insertion porin family